jgi:DNA-binding transcriptional LysR family regulator
MLSNTALNYFATVARRGSFQGGSEQLHVAVSAVSRQVSLLEKEVGAPLFERGRGRRPLRLTAAGEALLLHVQELEASGARLSAKLQAMRSLSKGHIRLGISDVFIRQLFPAALSALNLRYSGVTYEVEVASMRNVLDMLGRGDLDIGLVFNPDKATGVRKVFEVTLANHILVATGHPLARFQALRLSDCAEYGFAMPGPQLSSKWAYEDMFARANIRPNVVFTSNSYEMLLSAAAAGVAIAFVNAPLFNPPVLPDGRGYRCVELIDPLVDPTRLGICTHEGRVLTAPMQRLIDLLKESLESIATRA